MDYYNENVLLDIDPKILLHPLFGEWYQYVEDILLSDEFQKRKLFRHHYDLSVWDHSIAVSFDSFLASFYFQADPRVCAIAGLLHDFYSQAWISTPEIEKLDGGIHATYMKEKKPLFKMHGFVHAKDASLNYVKFFPELEDKRITDCIAKHMFPLTVIPPLYKEGFIITLVDKINSTKELYKPVVFGTTAKIRKFIFGRID